MIIRSMFISLLLSSCAFSESSLKFTNYYSEHNAYVRSYHNSQVDNYAMSKNMVEISRDYILKQCQYELICKIRAVYKLMSSQYIGEDIWLSDFWVDFSDPKNTKIILIDQKKNQSKTYKTIKENDNTLSIIPNINIA